MRSSLRCTFDTNKFSDNKLQATKEGTSLPVLHMRTVEPNAMSNNKNKIHKTPAKIQYIFCFCGFTSHHQGRMALW